MFSPSLGTQRHNFVVDFVQQHKPKKVSHDFLSLLLVVDQPFRGVLALVQSLVPVYLTAEHGFSPQVIDLGCADCRLLRRLRFLHDVEFLVGVDIKSSTIKKKMYCLQLNLYILRQRARFARNAENNSVDLLLMCG